MKEFWLSLNQECRRNIIQVGIIGLVAALLILLIPIIVNEFAQNDPMNILTDKNIHELNEVELAELIDYCLDKNTPYWTREAVIYQNELILRTK